MRDSRAWRRLVALLLVIDAVCLVASALVAVWIHSALDHRMRDNPYALSALTLVAGIAIFTMLGLYDKQYLLEGAHEYSAIARGCAFGLAAVSVANFLTLYPHSRTWIASSWLVAAPLLLAARYAVRRVAHNLRRHGHFVRRALLVGADANAVALAAQLASDRSGLHVVGFLDDYHPIGSVLLPGVKVVERPANLQQVAARCAIEDAIIMPQALPWETLTRLITAAAVAPSGPRVHLSAGFYDLLTTSVRFTERHHVALLTLNKARLSPWQAIVKRALDCAVAAVLLLGLSPVMATMVAWQCLHRRGQLLERRRVRGGNGDEFALLRFSSAEPFRSDFLQKLPGLLNVLAGKLSVVGPRPVDASDVPSKFLQMARLKPGLTGRWREIEDPAEQSLLDLYYIRSYSVANDMHVLARRLRNRLRRRRASVVSGALVTERSG